MKKSKIYTYVALCLCCCGINIENTYKHQFKIIKFSPLANNKFNTLNFLLNSIISLLSKKTCIHSLIYVFEDFEAIKIDIDSI